MQIVCDNPKMKCASSMRRREYFFLGRSTISETLIYFYGKKTTLYFSLTFFSVILFLSISFFLEPMSNRNISHVMRHKKYGLDGGLRDIMRIYDELNM